MSRHLLRRAAAAVLAVALFAAPVAAAPGPLSFDTAAEVRDLFAPLWRFFAFLLPDVGLAAEALETRCGIDPNGQPVCGESGTPDASTDTRCTIDPDGRTSCIEG